MATKPKSFATTNTRLPDAMLAEIARRVDSFSGPRLIECFAEANGLPSNSNLKLQVVRDRIKADSQRAESLSRYGFLGECDPLGALVIALDLKALEYLVKAISVLFSPERVTLCLLLHPTPDGQKLGLERLRPEFLDKPFQPSDDERREAVDTLHGVFGVYVDRFLELDRELNSAGHGAGEESADKDVPGCAIAEAAATELHDLRNVCRELEADNAKLRSIARSVHEAAKREQAASRKLGKAEDRVMALERTRGELEAELRAKRDECTRLADKVEQMQSMEENRVRLAVDAAKAAEYSGWLAYAGDFELEAKAEGEKASDLISRTETALARQAELDRHSGNRHALATRLESLRALRKRSRAALDDAMRPYPALAGLIGEIDAEIQRISALLDPAGAKAKSDLERGLDGLVDSAAPSGVLEDVAAAAVKLLPRDAEKRVQDHIRQVRRSALLNAQPDLHGALASGHVEQKDGLGAQETFRLAFNTGAPGFLLVDGHNVLGCYVKGRYAPLRPGQPNTDIRGRSQLADDIVRRFQMRPSMQVHLFFDGPDAKIEHRCENVTVRYSGGEGDHRADRAILNEIRTLRSLAGASPDAPAKKAEVFVVTNDADLSRKAKRLGAIPIPVNYFGDMLG